MKRSKKRPNYRPKVSKESVLLGDTSIGEMKAEISQKIQELRDRRRSFTLKQNRKTTEVLLSAEEYDRLNYEIYFLSKIHAGLEDVAAGRVYTDEELTRFLEKDAASDPKPSRRKSRRKADSRGRTRRPGTSKGKASKRGA